MASGLLSLNYYNMEFSIDIHTQINGEILIEDFSKEYGQYIDEDVEVVTSYDSYKYSESATLNTIIKVSISDATLIDVLLNDHTEDLDSCMFKVKDDGYYVVDHIIIPNMNGMKIHRTNTRNTMRLSMLLMEKNYIKKQKVSQKSVQLKKFLNETQKELL